MNHLVANSARVSVACVRMSTPPIDKKASGPATSTSISRVDLILENFVRDPSLVRILYQLLYKIFVLVLERGVDFEFLPHVYVPWFTYAPRNDPLASGGWIDDPEQLNSGSSVTQR